MPKITVLLSLMTLLISGCSAIPSSYRETCKTEVNAAWREMNIAKADGFAGTISYTKALGLITTARTMQTVENFDGCIKNAQKARFYTQESRAGR